MISLADHPGIKEAVKILHQGIRSAYQCSTQESIKRATAISHTAVINFLSKASPADIKQLAPRLYDQILKEGTQNP